MVGEKLKLLEEQGLAEDTIIFYYGDHGSGMPRSKRWPYFRHKCSFNHPCSGEVKHLSASDYKMSGKSTAGSASSSCPTLLSIAGKKPLAHMQGHAFMGKHEATEQEYGYGFRGRMDERYDMVRSVVGKRYIYIRNYMPQQAIWSACLIHVSNSNHPSVETHV